MNLSSSSTSRSRVASRRHSEPPALWVLLVGGSLLFHLLAWFVLRPFLFHPPQPEVHAAPISVEFMQAPSAQPGAIAAKGTPPITGNDSATPARSNSTDRPPTNSPAQSPQIAMRPTRINQSPVQEQKPVPRSPVNQSSRPAPSPSENRQRNEDSKPNNSQPRVPPLPEPPNVGSSTIASNSGSANSSSTGNSSLPSVPIGQNPGLGKGLKLSILNFANANRGRDIPDSSARPLESSKLFPEKAYQPTIELNLGSPIKLIVLIDVRGKVQQADVAKNSGSKAEAYDELAKQLIQEMPFAPAQQGGQPVEGLLEVELQIDQI